MKLAKASNWIVLVAMLGAVIWALAENDGVRAWVVRLLGG
jgi:hypothetical protein